MAESFSSGKYAHGWCDRCGDKHKLNALKLEWTGLKVCRACWDPKTALEFPTNFPADSEALYDPRPDIDIEANHGYIQVGSDIGLGFKLNQMTIEMGEVTVTIT